MIKKFSEVSKDIIVDEDMPLINTCEPDEQQVEVEQLPFQKSSKMKDLSRAAQENMSYLRKKLDHSKFDNIEKLCTVERENQSDPFWQIGYELVLYSDVKYIFRAAEHYQPIMPDVFNRLMHD